MESFFDLVSRRESCRNFSGASVEKEDLLKCIDAARLAPSACNSQPWSFIAITNQDLVSALAKQTQQAFTQKSGALIAVLEEKPNIKANLGMAIKNHDFVQMDIGSAASHICLAATQLGLATCILGWFNEGKVKELLDLPRSRRIRLLICVGHAATSQIRDKKRKSLAEVLIVKE